MMAVAFGTTIGKMLFGMWLRSFLSPFFSSHIQHSWDFADNYSRKLLLGSCYSLLSSLFFSVELAKNCKGLSIRLVHV